MQFDHMGLSEPLLRAVRAAGYQTPTEIQARAIPPALSGDDVIGRAKTGSGKTAAFVLPTLDRLAAGQRSGRSAVRALVLTPTRELAQQVSDSVRKYGRFLKLTGAAFYGGVSIEPQLKLMRNGIDVLAATPGRLLDHLERGSVDLSHCEVLVVDEADRMFDMGFIADVRRIIAKIPKQRQTHLFSATINAEVRRLSGEIMRDPVFVEVGVEGNPAESVRQQFYAVQKQEKLDLLFHMLGRADMDSVLVFSRTKHGANKIAKRLERGGIGTGVLHSNRSQNQRLQALEGFRAGRVRVLVATDIAARGLDIAGISHVINYDTPAFAEDYVHRIGRTGRAEATGDAITFVSSEERAYLRKIESFVGRRYAVDRFPGFVPAPKEQSAAAQPSAASSLAPRSRHGRRPTPGNDGPRERTENVSRDAGRTERPRNGRPDAKHRNGAGSERPDAKHRNGAGSERPRNGRPDAKHRNGAGSERPRNGRPDAKHRNDAGGERPRNGHDAPKRPERERRADGKAADRWTAPRPEREGNFRRRGNSRATEPGRGGKKRRQNDGARGESTGRRRDPRFAR